MNYFSNSPFLLGLLAFIAYYSGRNFIEYLIIILISSICLGFVSNTEEKNDFSFTLKYSLIAMLAPITRSLIGTKIDLANPYAIIGLSFFLICLLILSLSAFLTFLITRKLKKNLMKLKFNQVFNKISNFIFILYIITLLAISIYSLRNFYIKEKTTLPITNEVNLDNFKYTIYNQINYPTEKEYSTLLKRYEKVLKKDPSKISKKTIDDFNGMFISKCYMRPIGEYSFCKKARKLYKYQKNYFAENNPNDQETHRIKRIQLLDKNGGKACRTFGSKFSKEHFEKLLEIDKKICETGGRCDFYRDAHLYFLLSSNYDKEKVEKSYDDIISYLENLDTKDLRILHGIAVTLIYQFHSIVTNIDASVDLRQYYLQRQEKIEANIKKATELDKKHNLLSDSDYKAIAEMYKLFKETKKEDYYKQYAQKKDYKDFIIRNGGSSRNQGIIDPCFMHIAY